MKFPQKNEPIFEAVTGLRTGRSQCRCASREAPFLEKKFEPDFWTKRRFLEDLVPLIINGSSRKDLTMLMKLVISAIFLHALACAEEAPKDPKGIISLDI